MKGTLSMEKLVIMRCEICGNIVQVLNSAGGELFCCGQEMNKLEASVSEEAMTEKHVPIFIKYDNTCEIRVGEVLHPMTNEHYIMFIEAINDKNDEIHLKFLNPNDEPKLKTDNSKNYKKAIELLNKLLEVLETARSILNKISEKNKMGFNEKEIEDMKTEAYLKIANIYYIMKDYDNTIATLDQVPNIKSEDYSSLTVSKIINLFSINSLIKLKDYIDMLKPMKCKEIEIMPLLIWSI